VLGVWDEYIRENVTRWCLKKKRKKKEKKEKKDEKQ